MNLKAAELRSAAAVGGNADNSGPKTLADVIRYSLDVVTPTLSALPQPGGLVRPDYG